MKLFITLFLFAMIPARAETRQLTEAPHGHILTNTGCWSHDGKWIVYDVRPDAEGAVFEGERIERVHVETGEVEVLYRSRHGAHCGVVTASPLDDRVVFIHGPEHPTADWRYAGNHRRGVIVRMRDPGKAQTLDARDLVPPFTPGALRGGTHVHVFSGDAQWVSFTYQDHVLAAIDPRLDQRNVGVSVPGAVEVPRRHPRNHDGSYFSVLVTRTTAAPVPGSDEISRAYSDAWVGKDGYDREEGSRQKRAIAFLGDARTPSGETITELYLVDLPDDVKVEASGAPLAGTATHAPHPPAGVRQRRLTRTESRPFPGVQGPRHWPRSSPDGSRIAFFMKDARGVVQFWTVHPADPEGSLRQLTKSGESMGSAFSWSPKGGKLACVIGTAACVIDSESGEITRVASFPEGSGPRPEACVFSPDGRRMAYVREVDGYNQIFVTTVD